MKAAILLALAVLTWCAPARAASEPTIFDLVGKWEGAVEFGKIKIGMVLKIVKTPAGKVAVSMDIPDQGQKDIPIAAILFNNPSVRMEIDEFGAAYKGELSADRNQIVGGFDEGPGGRPIALSFKRSNQPDVPEPTQVFTFGKGEATDIRGYWKGSMTPFPGMSLTVGLSIGRIPDGTYKVAMDVPEQGAKGIRASSVTATNNTATIQWQLFQAVFDAKLSPDGKSLEGKWAQMGKTNAVTFQRIDGPITALPTGLSFERDAAHPEDVRGYWKGTLEVGGAKLRLALKAGRAPDGAYTVMMASLDQGGREIPSSSASFQAPKVSMEWKGIRGKYEGTINKEGTIIEGKWEQGGNPLPLKFERTPTFEGDTKK